MEWNMVSVWLLGAVCLHLLHGTQSTRESPMYMNQFAVHVPGGKNHADEIAVKHGFTNLGQIGSLKGYYLLEHNRIHKRSLTKNEEHHGKLSNEPEVKWVEQQREKRRVKRDGVKDFSGFHPFSDFATFLDRPSSRYSNIFPDPLYMEEWYLNGGAKDGSDMNVAPAWAKGYTGKNVVVSILDDGIQTNHPDLAQNYDPKASTDINENDNDPMPRDNGDNKHGTRCAGEVAAVAFNNYCGVGIAYNASIGGVRMLDGSVNDAVEARALSLNPNHIDIYSASWGPEDDGKTVDGPGPLARRAFINGVTTGRKGKGSIFVWASGNGGRHTDSCNCDGYTNSIFTLSISSATQAGFKPWYLEECSSTLATTYSSGTPGHDKSIATVDMDARLRPDHICTVEHTGTSASAPLAAGLVALSLEANPSLTWRDVQHIVVMTSNPAPLMKETGWIVNGVGRKVSHKFGYGLMDGSAMVNLAEEWTSVPPQHICKSREVIEEKQISPGFGEVLTVSVDASGCSGTVNEVAYLEHVQCKVSLRYFPRGNIRLVLTSPQGTPSVLLMERPRDIISSNFDDWPFLSVHYWGENPQGRWTLQVITAGNRHLETPGVLRRWQLIFYGTATNPVRLRSSSHSFAFPTNIPQGESYVPSIPSSNLFPQFKNFPNIFSAAGSEKQNTYSFPGTKIKMIQDDRTNEIGDPLECHESCATCSGPMQDSCLTCEKNHFYLTDLGLCMQNCPEGYYEDHSTRSCVSCEGNCASCPDGPSICSSCDHHLVLYNNTCLAACPKSFYELHEYRCQPCDRSCETCVKGGSNGCVTCPDGRPTQNGMCTTEKICPPSCLDCEDRESCNYCLPGYELTEEGVCVLSNTSCKPGEILGDNGCEICVDRSNCTRCPVGQHLMNMKCSAACDNGFYSDSGWCEKCAPNCLQCIGFEDNQCISCKEGLLYYDGTCVSACPEGTLVSKKTCARCHHFCSTCSGEGPYACTSCAPGRYLDAAAKLCMPCQECNSTNLHQCCYCDPDTGKCHLPTGKRRITSEQAAKEREDEMLAEASAQVYSFDQSPFANVTALTVAACASVVVLFGVIFFALQVRSGEIKRRHGGYTKLPIHESRFSYGDSFTMSRSEIVTSVHEDIDEEVNTVT